MLLDPFEEQFDLPPAAVKLGNGERRQSEVVGQKDQRLVGLGVLEADASQRRFEALAGVEASEQDRLIANQSSGAVDGMRIAPSGLEIRFAAGYEEAADLVEPVQALEVEEAPIHDVERAGLGQELIEDIDLVHLAVANKDKGRDIAAQIEQRVQFDRGLGRPKRRPRKYRQTQIDGRRIQRIDRILQVDPEGLVDIQRSGDGDQALGEVGVDAP